jgi:hypothetical protein
MHKHDMENIDKAASVDERSAIGLSNYLRFVINSIVRCDNVSTIRHYLSELLTDVQFEIYVLIRNDEENVKERWVNDLEKVDEFLMDSYKMVKHEGEYLLWMNRPAYCQLEMLLSELELGETQVWMPPVEGSLGPSGLNPKEWEAWAG